jgi:hypothetical protein
VELGPNRDYIIKAASGHLLRQKRCFLRKHVAVSSTCITRQFDTPANQATFWSVAWLSAGPHPQFRFIFYFPFIHYAPVESHGIPLALFVYYVTLNQWYPHVLFSQIPFSATYCMSRQKKNTEKRAYIGSRLGEKADDKRSRGESVLTGLPPPHVVLSSYLTG